MKSENGKLLMDVLIHDARNGVHLILGFLEIAIPFRAGAELSPEATRPFRALLAEDSEDSCPVSKAHDAYPRSYKSKYFNLDPIPKGWTDGEFAGVIQILESRDRHTLLMLLQHFQIVFGVSPDTLDAEDMISALLSNTPKHELITALKRLKSPKYTFDIPSLVELRRDRAPDQ